MKQYDYLLVGSGLFAGVFAYFAGKQGNGPIDIAVIRFPRISNFTDLAAFECREEVSLRYISQSADFGEPDLVILPGTKSTIADLLWMRQNGLEG